jgi:glycosyltransferase involved in cell wall biosynthesis
MRTGGAERQLLNYLLAANRDEFRHTLVCLGTIGELALVAESNGIPVVSMPVRTRYAIASVRHIAKWMQSEDVAVVHTHMHHAALWGRVGGKAGGVPVLISTEHGKELWKGSLRLFMDRILSKWTARHIAVSQDCMQIRTQREKVDPKKLVVIPNGVPIPEQADNAVGRKRIRAEFGLGDDVPVIGTVGRVVQAKGYEYLLAALQLLRRKYPTIIWLAVGDGDQRDALAAQANSMGLASAVVWTGRRDDVTDLLAAMDIWTMSSIREGLPVALLEAMAAGRPIVATNVGGIPDAVTNEKEGLLVPSADPVALAKSIEELIEDPDRAMELGSAAYLRAKTEYGIDSVAQRIEDIYRQELELSLGHNYKR